MPRIKTDPSGETCPDFSGEIFEDMCNMAKGGNEQMTDEEAINKLVTTWHATQQKKVAAWEAQVQAENEERQRQQQEPNPPEQNDGKQRRDNRRQQEAAENQEEEETRPIKAKPFIFNPNVGIDTMPLNRPAQYAINKLKDKEYVEIDYFTPHGCSLAQGKCSTNSTDTLGLRTGANGIIVLQPLSAIKPLKNICQDTELTWGKVNVARHAMMRQMLELGKTLWSAHIIQVLSNFFGCLDAHPIREEEYGDKAIVKYQAIVRREWYNHMEVGRGMNLGIINDNLLKQICQDIVIQKGSDCTEEVSNIQIQGKEHD
ncbi:hypothetical protein BDQ17DRAFT_1259521 [Cyathus striatus]|nr:hypothetical protein BDQ17DRAFT_1259521 [Cyathus striatus]